jgi:hypothetical protein
MSRAGKKRKKKTDALCASYVISGSLLHLLCLGRFVQSLLLPTGSHWAW